MGRRGGAADGMFPFEANCGCMGKDNGESFGWMTETQRGLR